MDRATNLLLILQRVKHRNTHVLDAVKQIEALYTETMKSDEQWDALEKAAYESELVEMPHSRPNENLNQTPL